MDLDRARKRTLWSLVVGVGLGSTGNIAAGTIGTIAAQELSGSTALSGAPSASVVLGAAIGSSVLAALMVRRGRRFGLTTGYVVGVGGAGLAIGAVVVGSLPLLLLATVFIGFGGSSNQLSRYTAADMFPETRRASAIATVVWGSTIGAIIGPNLISAADTFATSIGLPAISGAYLIPAAFVGMAALLSFGMLRPDPYALADESALEAAAEVAAIGAAPVPLRVLLGRATVLAALATLIVGQIAMTSIMTMTPLHMTDHGGSIALVGLVISAHTAGMFALSPLSGWLTDRLGSPIVMYLGLATLAGAGMLAAIAPPDGGALLFVALFLLGYGWNLCFVAGSALLAVGLTLAERTRLQGATDTMIWGSAVVASLASGVIVAVASYTVLGLLPAFFIVTPLWILARRRQAIAAGARASA